MLNVIHQTFGHINARTLQKTLADIGVELKLVPTAQPKRDDDKRTVAHKRIVMAAAVSRYYRQAQHIVANTALGVFPKSD